MPPGSEPADLFSTVDPVAAFWSAHADQRRIALRTSGTMGASRVVVRTTQSWADSFDYVAQAAGISGGSRLWVPGPLTSTMNLFAVVHAQAVGATVVSTALDASHVVLTPLALVRALDAGVVNEQSTVVVAGDSVSAGLRQRCLEEGLRLHHYYGASELSFVAWGAEQPELVPIPGVECRIDDAEIWVRSPFLCEGYLDGDDTSPLRWSDDGFATVGDRGRWRGSALEIYGRGEAGITTAGVTVVVAEVEQVLRREARGAVIVVGVPDQRFGEMVCAVVTDPDDADRLHSVARAELEVGYRPRRWYTCPSLPMSSAGKPDRGQLTGMLVRGELRQVGR